MLTSHDFAASRLPRVPDRRGQATATPIHTASATHSLPSQDGMGGGLVRHGASRSTRRWGRDRAVAPKSFRAGLSGLAWLSTAARARCGEKKVGMCELRLIKRS